MTKTFPQIAKITAVAVIGTASVLATVSPALATSADAIAPGQARPAQVSPAQANAFTGTLTCAHDHSTTVILDNQSNKTFFDSLQGLHGSSVHDTNNPDLVDPGQIIKIGVVHNNDHQASSANVSLPMGESVGESGFTGSFYNGCGPSTGSIQYQTDLPSYDGYYHATYTWANGNADTTLTITVYNGKAPAGTTAQ